MKNFILDSINAPTELYKANQQNYRVDSKPLHLLDLLRTTLIQPVAQDTGCFRERLRKILKGFLGEKVFDKLTCKKKLIWDSSFRNIEELKAAGISLKPSKTSSMRGISFSWGTLKIPPIISGRFDSSQALESGSL
ncbi:hypothetical protein Dsin_012127 [Dipteronia sinensis]|uniref:Uncharacterized protein n=1 Tax=Dipteronia sinensis TaxID=43782 RepID=A0AAE0AIT9_9ROSI|nr:hypothetical protein Dsin_012127 [Dipteronia sinensis]